MGFYISFYSPSTLFMAEFINMEEFQNMTFIDDIDILICKRQLYKKFEYMETITQYYYIRVE